MGIPAEALLPFVLGENGSSGGSVTVDAQLSSTSRNPVQNKAITGALADEYDASKTYAVGDLCIHNGSLYACTTAIETAEAWNAAHWKTSNFSDELSELNRQLSDVEENQIPELKNAIGQLQPTATASDVGKALIVKTVDTQTGKPTSYEYGDGSGGAVNDVQINGTSIVSGGVANIPFGDNSNQGVVRGRTDRGISFVNGWAQIAPAASNVIKSSDNGYLPVVPSHQHESAFYGLAKAAGDATQSASSNPVGTYTDAAKSAIQTMLGVGNSQFELIRFVEIESDAQTFYIDTDDKNESFELTDFVIAVNSVAASDATTEGYLKAGINYNNRVDGRIADISNGIRRNGSQATAIIYGIKLPTIGYFVLVGKKDNFAAIDSSGEISANLYALQNIGMSFSNEKTVTSIFVGTDSTSLKLGAGSRIAVYGIRK